MKNYSGLAEYLKENLTADDLRSLSQNGADGGFNGLVYHGELMDVFTANEDEIIRLWEDMGGNFPTIENGLNMVVSRLVWGACEMIAEQTAEEMDAEAEEAENEAGDEA